MDSILNEMDSDLKEAHQNMGIFLERGACNNSSGNDPHFKIPKLHHLFDVVSDIHHSGVPSNFNSDPVKAQHIPCLKEPYKQTNRKDYTEQMLTALSLHEHIVIEQGFQQWSELYDEGNSQDDEANLMDPEGTTAELAPQQQQSNSSSLVKHGIIIAKNPHHHHVPIDTIISTYDLDDLVSSVCLFEAGYNGTSRSQASHYHYPRDLLPPSYGLLDIWDSFQIFPSYRNSFYNADPTTIHGKGLDSRHQPGFHTAFIMVYPNAQQIHHESHISPYIDLKLIFI